jgi:hypothetical protein
MRPPISYHRWKWTLITTAVFLLLVLGGWTFVFAEISAGVTGAATSAMARYTGGRVEALSALVDCDDCSLSDRNRAIWALGQLRDARALPVLERHYTGGPCNHSADICQDELQKAIKAIRLHSVVWFGYRDLPKL